MVVEGVIIEVLTPKQAYSKGYWGLSEALITVREYDRKFGRNNIKNILFRDGVYIGVKQDDETNADAIARLNK